ncbi:ABC transporter permease [Clostridium lundense]|uniref:ABC transporter permease n=1 Tax=Clostridium lundense TaxID=319475 RepID=UPI000489C1AC|nr:ABC transporter permease [Clostridium lundense]
MLKLIKCEFWKLKRKKFIQLVIASAFLFPIPLTFIMMKPSIQERFSGPSEIYDALWNEIIGFGIQFLFPCILGTIAAILFFMERDNDTFKNLRTIPVSSTEMVFAKICVLFIVSIVFCVASTVASIVCGSIIFEVNGIWYKLWFSVVMGIFTTAGTLPLVVVIVFFSRSYIFSILLCVFYSFLNMSATFMYDVLPKSVLHIFPNPLTTFWSAGNMAKHIKMDLTKLEFLIPSTIQVVTTLFIMATASIFIIVRLYRIREE